LQHRLIPSYFSIDLFTAGGAFINIEELKLIASRVCAMYHQTGAESIAPFASKCLPSAGWACYKKGAPAPGAYSLPFLDIP